MNKWIKVAIFLIVCVLIIMPMLLQNDIVQGIKVSADMKAHTDVIRAMGDGEQVHTSYYGQAMLAYIMKPIANSEKLDVAYLWLNFVMLIASAFALYYVTSRLVGNKSALLVVPMAMFCTTGIFALFRYGVIFNIVNMYVILPFAIYFAVKWLDDKGWRYLGFAIVLFALFSVFHYTALYLPYAVGCSLAIYTIYAFIRHNTKPLLKAVPFAIGLVAMNIILSSFLLSVTSEIQTAVKLLPTTPPILPTAPVAPTPTPPVSIPPTPSTPPNTEAVISLNSLRLLAEHWSAIMIALFCLAVGGLVVWHRKIKIDSQSRIWLFILGSFATVLLGGLLTLATAEFNRIAIDLATIIAIATACVLGLIMQSKKFGAFDVMAILLVVAGSTMTLISWVR